MESASPSHSPASGSKLAIPLSAALVAVGLVALVFGGWGVWWRYHAMHSRAPLPDARTIVAADQPQVAETTPSDTDSYSVAADQPRSISLPSIGAKGLIEKVGINKQNAIVAPTNVNFAGWYALGAKPGDAGVSLIDGHVQGYYNPGIFKNLSKLKAGDTFSVEFGDRSRRQFEVVSVTSYPVAEAGKLMLRHQKDITKQLNLITCDGSYDASEHQYTNRVLIVSRAI